MNNRAAGSTPQGSRPWRISAAVDPTRSGDKPADGFAAFVKRLHELGVTEADLDRMTRRNPSALLGL